MSIDKKNLATVEMMWRREVEAAATYKHLANRESDQKRRDILMRLADQEDKHAARWSERIAATTGRVPDPKEVERGLSWFQRISDPNVVLHRLEQEENKAEAEYDQLMQRLSNPMDRQIAEEAMLEERDHAVVLRTLAGGRIPTPRSTLDSILGRERWHVRGTGWIGDAIYGVNDGLGAVFGIVSGMAGYTGGSEVVLAAGLAGTLASALSMGAGAYLSSKSQREVYESEIAREQAEIDEDPHEELLELELFYQLKGFSVEEARSMAERLQKQPKQFLRTLVHEELGLNEETFPNPWRSTLSATVSTAIGGFIPIIPFFFAVGMPAVIASFVISTAAHFVVGASKSLVTTRSWWASGTEMTVVGVIEAAITYGLGVAFAGHR
ncbi:MAG TPA: VIT1/CCC1 transporter family protein [Vicinamibacterales bacterium]|jgi:VIT1/CCC1 family predicted Fe2+/Mn2+ transporter/rubrerythrin|nr:VIT1/CCC1 transporter family protein [Vicinamibacterales bacterium]